MATEAKPADRLVVAKHELLNALRECLSGLDRQQAEGRLSSILSGLWNEALKEIVDRLPRSGAKRP